MRAQVQPSAAALAILLFQVPALTDTNRPVRLLSEDDARDLRFANEGDWIAALFPRLQVSTADDPEAIRWQSFESDNAAALPEAQLIGLRWLVPPIAKENIVIEGGDGIATVVTVTPTALHVELVGPVDFKRLKISGRKGLVTRDLMPVLRPFLTAQGVRAPRVELPEGKFVIEVELYSLPVAEHGQTIVRKVYRFGFEVKAA